MQLNDGTISSQAALICRNEDQWTKSIPIVLLGIRAAYNENLHGTATKWYVPLQFPGIFLVVIPETNRRKYFLNCNINKYYITLPTNHL